MLLYQLTDELNNVLNVTNNYKHFIENSKKCYNLQWNEVILAFNCAIEKLINYSINALEHLIIAVIIYVVFCLILYKLYNRGHSLRYEHGFQRAKRILFITAHPDDECMFFGPTIYKLAKQFKSNIYLLCMSSGNKNGLGKKRINELWESCCILGIPETNITIYNCTLLPDDPEVRWRADIISKIILHHVESLDIDTIVTFDKHGVSQHSNHCSIYYATAYLSIEKRLPKNCKIYTLDTINLLRKYWLFFDMPLSFILSTNRYILKWSQRSIVINAMKQHHSQYVWFRRLYVQFSRYMIINTYQQLDMIDLELDLTIDD